MNGDADRAEPPRLGAAALYELVSAHDCGDLSAEAVVTRLRECLVGWLPQGKRPELPGQVDMLDLLAEEES